MTIPLEDRMGSSASVIRRLDPKLGLGTSTGVGDERIVKDLS